MNARRCHSGPPPPGNAVFENAEQIPVVQKRLGVLIVDEGDGPRWLISTTRDLRKEVRREILTAIFISCAAHFHCLFGNERRYR